MEYVPRVRGVTAVALLVLVAGCGGSTGGASQTKVVVASGFWPAHGTCDRGAPGSQPN
jgi:hypothetical protein